MVMMATGVPSASRDAGVKRQYRKVFSLLGRRQFELAPRKDCRGLSGSYASSNLRFADRCVETNERPVDFGIRPGRHSCSGDAKCQMIVACPRIFLRTKPEFYRTCLAGESNHAIWGP